MTLLSTFAQRFFRFEVDRGLFSRTYEGGPFWNHIRYEVFEELSVALGTRPTLVWPSRRARAGRAARLAGEAVATAEGFVRPAAARVRQAYDLVVFDCDSKRLVDGRLVNVVTYPVVERLARNYSILLLDLSVPGGAQASYPCDVVSIRSDYLACRLAAALERMPQSERKGLVEIERELESEFGVRPSVADRVRSSFLYQRRMRRRMADLLSRARPHVVLFQNDGRKYYSEAAHDVDARAVELMHGATDVLDALHSYGHGAKPGTGAPDDILTFGRYWNDKIRTVSRRVEVGFPYFESVVAKAKIDAKPRSPKTVMGISSLDHSLALSLGAFAKSAPDWTVWYKLRPEEYAAWRALYPASLTEIHNFRFIGDDEKPLVQRLGEVEYVVSSCSTALYEAFFMGAIPVVHAGWGREFVSDLVDEGWALAANGPEDILTIVRHGMRPRAVPDPELFFATGGLDNIERTVRSFAKKSGVMSR